MRDGQICKKINDIKTIQNLELNILKQIKMFCKDSKIDYSLGAGTMLGAIRHQGFIPWDDDIDIFMTHDNYDIFCKKTKENHGKISERYIVKYPDTKNYFFPFIKVVDIKTIAHESCTLDMELGLWVDIFPIDYYGGTEKEIEKLLKDYFISRKNLQRCLMSSTNIRKKILLWSYNLAMRMIKKDSEYWKKRLLKKVDCKDRKYAGTMVWEQSRKDLYPADFFEGYTEVMFEREKFQCFKRYDDILRHRYGNYMELPPEQERKNHDLAVYLLSDED